MKTKEMVPCNTLQLGEGREVAHLRREVISRALKHSDSWEVVVGDPLATGEFSYLEEEPTATVAGGLEETLDVLREVNAEIDRRVGALQKAGTSFLHKLYPVPRRILVVVKDLEGLPGSREGEEVLERLYRVALVGSFTVVRLHLSAAHLSRIGGKLLSRLRKVR